MGSGQRSNNYLVKQASQAMDKFKQEIASELNIDTSKVQGGYWGYMVTRDTGAIGGNMVRRMIEAAERSLAEQAIADVKVGFQAGLSSSANASQTLKSNTSFNTNQSFQ